ncbi:transcriptional regulator, HxlR family [Dyadobacter koreensis]|uniref:Transcriptional regulator, HxlR family n=1 Tax=Dyadobacter koreensis TaxID=408657 RepID=A0A1H6S7Y3_9BACT|nr:helix-turn-helix domain-containing protein [Dyadobacter koreensis]SEI59532.1 transcriptional regulator, HxlR family [Dyadobacter koreensis]
MYEKKIPLPLECGLMMTREILGGKWKPNLLLAISVGISRPSQLHREIPQSTKRVLNLQLKELEEFEMIEKKVYHQLPPKVEYRLTERGKSLMPLLQQMNEWGEKNRPFIKSIILKRTKALD